VIARVLVLSLLLTGVARAEEKPPAVAWGFAAGLALALVPLAVGSGLAATAGPEDITQKHAGVHMIAAGFALAPIVSHLITREWKRAAIFGAAPIAFMAIVMGVLENSEAILDRGPIAARVTFGAALALELLATGIGLADTLGAGERWRKKHNVMLVPTVSQQGAGLSLGGTW
jgi:hypothetical protein